MKTLMEEYGVAIMAALAIVGLIIFVGPLKNKTRDVLENQSEQEGQIIVNTMHNTSKADLAKIRALFDEERTNQDVLEFSYYDVYTRYQDEIDSLTNSSG